MTRRAIERIRRVEAKRPPAAPSISVLVAASGEDRTDAIVDWIVALLDTAPPTARG